MILDDARVAAPKTRVGGDATLDDLLRRAAQRRADEVALIDPPNRESFTDGKPRRLTYAQADRMASAIAGRLRRMGLHTDAIVGLQMANTVDGVLTLIGVLRAGLIAMPLPLLWRRAEAVAALSRVGANALIVNGRVGGTDHFALAMNVAAEIFPVRYVCGFGNDAPDGVIRLDDLYESGKPEPSPASEAGRALPPGPGAHLAIVTWDRTADGLVPVGRSHAEMIAGGLAILLEGGLKPNEVILSTLTMSSFAGLTSAVVSWLLLGGTLALHQPFDADTLLAQRAALDGGTVVVPGPLVEQLAAAGLLSPMKADGLANIIAMWRAPERLTRATPWSNPRVRLTDVHAFGEVGLVAATRGQDGRPAAIRFGTVTTSRGTSGAIDVAEIAATPAGTVAMRGPMVPRAAFPPGAERGKLPHLKIAPSGFVDTGYACRGGILAMEVNAPPPGLVSIGGYRLAVRELQDLVARADHAGTLAVLPDALCGHRLAASAAEPASVRKALANAGASPLLIAAFHDTPRPAA